MSEAVNAKQGLALDPTEAEALFKEVNLVLNQLPFMMIAAGNVARATTELVKTQERVLRNLRGEQIV